MYLNVQWIVGNVVIYHDLHDSMSSGPFLLSLERASRSQQACAGAQTLRHHCTTVRQVKLRVPCH